jgi:hypothetical protein
MKSFVLASLICFVLSPLYPSLSLAQEAAAGKAAPKVELAQASGGAGAGAGAAGGAAGAGATSIMTPAVTANAIGDNKTTDQHP